MNTTSTPNTQDRSSTNQLKTQMKVVIKSTQTTTHILLQETQELKVKKRKMQRRVSNIHSH